MISKKPPPLRTRRPITINRQKKMTARKTRRRKNGYRVRQKQERTNRQIKYKENEEKKERSSQKAADSKQTQPQQDVLAIGDSVMLDIASYLRQSLPHVTIDGKVGRQVSQALQLTSEYASFNQPNKAVIIELGTNGYFTNSQIESLISSFSKADIYLVNTRVPRQWESKVNESLRRQAESRKNVTLVDWHAKALQHLNTSHRTASISYLRDQKR